MKTTVKEIDGRIVATLIGDLDTAAAVDVEKTLQPLYESSGRDIVIDCTDLDYISSSGLRILLGIFKQTKAHGSRLVLRNVNEGIRDVFKMTGFNSIFKFEESRE